MSDLLKHVLVSEIVGEGIYRSKSPKKLHFACTLAFGAGLTSHALMDLVDPDYVVNWFNFTNIRPAIFYVSVQLIFTFLILGHILREGREQPVKMKIKLFAIAGGIIPDVIDAIYTLNNPSAWYNGDLLFFWHRSHGQTFVMSMGATLAISLSLYFFRFYLLPQLVGAIKHSKT